MRKLFENEIIIPTLLSSIYENTNTQILLDSLIKDMDIPIHDGLTPLYIAVNTNQEALALLYIENGASPFHPYLELPSLLFLAIHKGQLKVIQALLLKYPELMACPDENPLIFAIIQGKVNLIKCLSENTQDIFQTVDNPLSQYYGWNALQVAIYEEELPITKRLAIAEILLNKGLTLDENLQKFLAIKLYEAIKSNHMENIQALVKSHPFLLNLKDDNGKTPLFHAVKNAEVFAFLFKYSASLNLLQKNHKDKKNRTLLDYSIKSNFDKGIALLIQEDFELTTEDLKDFFFDALIKNLPQTALIMIKKYPELMQWRANISFINAKPAIFNIDIYQNLQTTLAIILELPDTSNTLAIPFIQHIASLTQHQCTDKKCTEECVNPFYNDSDLSKVLFSAIQKGKKSIVIELLDTFPRLLNDKSTSPFIVAASFAQTEIMDFLIQKGADIYVLRDHKNALGYLLQAASTGNLSHNKAIIASIDQLLKSKLSLDEEALSHLITYMVRLVRAEKTKALKSLIDVLPQLDNRYITSYKKTMVEFLIEEIFKPSQKKFRFHVDTVLSALSKFVTKDKPLDDASLNALAKLLFKYLEKPSDTTEDYAAVLEAIIDIDPRVLNCINKHQQTPLLYVWGNCIHKTQCILSYNHIINMDNQLDTIMDIIQDSPANTFNSLFLKRFATIYSNPKRTSHLYRLMTTAALAESLYSKNLHLFLDNKHGRKIIAKLSKEILTNIILEKISLNSLLKNYDRLIEVWVTPKLNLIQRIRCFFSRSYKQNIYAHVFPEIDFSTKAKSSAEAYKKGIIISHELFGQKRDPLKIINCFSQITQETPFIYIEAQYELAHLYLSEKEDTSKVITCLNNILTVSKNTKWITESQIAIDEITHQAKYLLKILSVKPKEDCVVKDILKDLKNINPSFEKMINAGQANEELKKSSSSIPLTSEVSIFKKQSVRVPIDENHINDIELIQ